MEAAALGALFSNADEVCFVLSNPRQPDNPIIFASECFFRTTGYEPHEILGRNCRLLQGPATSTQAIMELRSAVSEERSTSVVLLNYRKDRSTFWNALHIAPVRGASQTVEYFIGIQSDVTQHIASSIPDGAAVEAVAEEEADQARVIAADINRHAAEIHLQRRQHSTCGAADTVPSSLLCILGTVAAAFVLSDPNLPDCEMVYCSPGFLQMTGYSCEECINHNCRFLQGPGTDQREVQRIRDAMEATPPRAVTATLLNYRKDGTPFRNQLHVAPIRDADGRVQFFCGVQVDLDAQKAPAAAAALELPGQEGGMNGGNAVIPDTTGLLMQKGVVGAVRVAARSLSTHGLRRAKEDQHQP